MTIIRSSVVAGATVLTFLAGQAQARAHLLSATPSADGAGPSPQTIILHFSEPLEPKDSVVTLMKADGSNVDMTSSLAPDDPKTMNAAPTAALPKGGYMVMWRVVGADGQSVNGDYNFSVR